MMILHQNHIIQRDLKPENILLDINYHPRITDFGLSKKFDPYHSMYQSITKSGTVSYMAPEVISGNNFNTKADVYSFGVIMYEIITGKRAFKKFIDEQKKLKKKVSKGFRPEIEEGTINKSLKKLIEKCWSSNPRERPTASELFKKLSLSNDEDYFNEFYDDNQESCIVSNEEEIDDEFSVNKEYCLDGVDLGELFEYIDEISEDPISLVERKKTKEMQDIEEKISTLETELNNNKKLNEKMTEKITSLESQLNESKEESIKFKDDNIKLNEQIQKLTEKVTSLESQLNESKEESIKIKDDNIKLNEQIQRNSLKISIFESEIKKIDFHNKSEDETTEKIEKLSSQIFAQSLIISSMNRTTENRNYFPIPQKIESIITADISEDNPGLLCILKNKNKNPFDCLFIASQSTNDIFNLIDKLNSTFITPEKDHFFIEFHLKEAVIMNGMKIYSSSGSFPQSFDIQVDGKLVKSIKETAELSEPNSRMKIQFNSIKGEKIRFIQTGPSRDKGNNTLWFKRFEIMSSESKYSEGVFTSLIKETESKNPHKCPVLISASNFDLNGFHLLNNKSLIYTLSKENSWFQIELTKGLAILKGFRLKKSGSIRLKSFRIICTNDPEQPDDSWTTLIEIDEKIKDENCKTLVMEFDDVSPPVKFIRLINTGPNWSNRINLVFHHLDFFGVYF